MNPSNYNKYGNWSTTLTKPELDFEITTAIKIFTIHGNDEPALKLWRKVRSYGTPVLQQYIWRLLLTNGIFIVRAKDGSVKVDRPNVTDLIPQEVAWYVGANILTAKKDKKNIDIFLDCNFKNNKLILEKHSVKNGKVIKGCLITGVVPDVTIEPHDKVGFNIPEKL